ncbi:MAG: type II toxin-antitoxin system Phd/YefM family antitoxin [Chloroflexota bacterium]|nr:type II toxin-antitoxin system Phd/YefM family antitoxin [Chloroflexota bacterium]
MTKRVSAREARAHFAELTDRVRYTGEPIILEKQGQAFAAVVSLEDFDELERIKGEQKAASFSRRAAQAAREAGGPEPTEEEIADDVKRTREALYRQRYGAA